MTRSYFLPTSKNGLTRRRLRGWTPSHLGRAPRHPREGPRLAAGARRQAGGGGSRWLIPPLVPWTHRGSSRGVCLRRSKARHLGGAVDGLRGRPCHASPLVSGIVWSHVLGGCLWSSAVGVIVGRILHSGRSVHRVGISGPRSGPWRGRSGWRRKRSVIRSVTGSLLARDRAAQHGGYRHAPAHAARPRERIQRRQLPTRSEGARRAQVHGGASGRWRYAIVAHGMARWRLRLGCWGLRLLFLLQGRLWWLLVLLVRVMRRRR